jgi:hypothetical protein
VRPSARTARSLSCSQRTRGRAKSFYEQQLNSNLTATEQQLNSNYSGMRRPHQYRRLTAGGQATVRRDEGASTK